MIVTEAPVAVSEHEIAGGDLIRVGFVMHIMQVAGAEVLVARILQQLRGQIEPTIFCLDGIGKLGEELQLEGVEVISLGRRPGRDWGLATRLAKEVRARGIELLHAHQYTPFFYAALARLQGAWGTQLVFTEHGRHYPDRVSTLRRLGNRLLLSRLPARITACCRFSAEALRTEDGFGNRIVEVIYNGIDADEFAPVADNSDVRRQLGLNPSRKYVVHVARFHPVKDHETLVKVFRIVADSRSDADLLLVGDGPGRRDIEAMVAENRLTDRVQFLGIRQDVSDILSACDAFVLSSVSEAASLTLLEAMASECPVVVTDVGGNGELVRQGIDGLLTPRQDAAAMASALLEVLGNPQRARAFGISARERVCTIFQQRDTVQRFATLYSELARPSRLVLAR